MRFIFFFCLESLASQDNMRVQLMPPLNSFEHHLSRVPTGWIYITSVRYRSKVHTEKSFQNLIISTRNQTVFTISG